MTHYALAINFFRTIEVYTVDADHRVFFFTGYNFYKVCEFLSKSWK